MTATHIIPARFDLTDPDIDRDSVPHGEFAALRGSAPVFWAEQEPEARAGMEGGTGYWAVTRHADVAATRRTRTSLVTLKPQARKCSCMPLA